MQDGADSSDGSFNAVLPGPDAIHMCQGGNQPDGAVPAHPEVADIIEEDHTGCARRIRWPAQESANDYLGAPRLIDDGRPKCVVLSAKAFEALRQRATA
jgi:hypothetical protein